MQNEKEYNEQLDDFSRLVRQKLEGHRIPVDADSWTQIQQHLKPKRYRLWWLAGAAAAVAVLVFVFLIRSHNDIGFGRTAAGQLPLAKEKDFVSFYPKQEQPNKVPLLQSNPVKKKLATRSVGMVSEQSDSVTSKSHGSNTVASIENPLLSDSVARAKEDALSKVIAEAEYGNIYSDSAAAKPNVNPVSKAEPKVWIIQSNKKGKEEKWLLAANFSSNGSASDRISSNRQLSALNDDLLGNSPYKVGMFNSSLTNSDYMSVYDEADHSLPLAFGLSVRKNITNRIGIETGLVYTYLSSRFKLASLRGTPLVDAKQELHYLGVPLNLVVYLWDNPKWNIYISAGGMGEKGLKRSLSYSANDTDRYMKDGIKGLQWSLNASIGVSYKVYQDWGIYFEPRYSYYFDNDQPVSIRTDKKNVIGFNLGLRFEFK